MINAFLIVNKPSIAPDYLEKHNILHIAHYTNSLSAIDLNTTIIDVDKLLYIYYGDVKDDSAFKADLSILRNRLESAYFTCRSFMFILVKARPGLTDYINAALSNIVVTNEDLEIIYHDKELMLPELSNYISGVSIGDTTKNTYIDVYVTEVGKEDKERYNNIIDENVSAIVPSLVDEVSLYKNKVVSLSSSFNNTIIEQEKSKDFVFDAAPHLKKIVRFMDTIIVSGEEYTDLAYIGKVLCTHFESLGERVLLVNLLNKDISYMLNTLFNTINLQQIWHKYLPEHLISYINLKFVEYPLLLSNEYNINSVTTKIVITPKEVFEKIHKIESYSLTNLKTAFILHKRKESFDNAKQIKEMLNTLIVDNKVFNDDFNMSNYKQVFENISCVMLPTNTEQESNFFYDCFNEIGIGDTDD